MPGLVNGLSKQDMSYKGFSLIFEQPYDYPMPETDIEKFKDVCNQYTILCFAGGLSASETIDVLACAYCFDVLTINPEFNLPVLRGTAWWYYAPFKSIGFASTDRIVLDENNADICDPSDKGRLSWMTDGYNRAYRLGDVLWPKSDYSKYVFAKYGDLGKKKSLFLID